jgi:peptidyl-prolyl cis-trans isomerase-like 1
VGYAHPFNKGSCLNYIKVFELISGGDPTGTGKGGASIYGRHFDDEIHEELKHTG